MTSNFSKVSLYVNVLKWSNFRVLKHPVVVLLHKVKMNWNDVYLLYLHNQILQAMKVISLFLFCCWMPKKFSKFVKALSDNLELSNCSRYCITCITIFCLEVVCTRNNCKKHLIMYKVVHNNTVQYIFIFFCYIPLFVNNLKEA